MDINSSAINIYDRTLEGEKAPMKDLHTLTLAEYILWIILYGTVAFLAVAGNLLVIYIVSTCPKLQNVTSYFIVNLSIADAMTGLMAIPFKFQAALLQMWPLPAFMCSLVPFIETVSLSVSVFTLTGTAVDRFQTVVLKSNRKMSRETAKFIIVCIWAISVACSVPYGWDHRIFPRNVTEPGGPELIVPACYPRNGDKLWWKIYNVYLTIIQYYVPLIIINGAYCIIAYQVWLAKPTIDDTDERSLRFRKHKKKVVKMLLIVVTVFTFCWLPYETYLVLNEVREGINDYYYINVIFFCCHWLAMSNSCLNPIIYAIYNDKFQREYKRVFCTLCGNKFLSSATNGATMLTLTTGDGRTTTESIADSMDRLNTAGLTKSMNLTQSLPGIADQYHLYIASELGKDDDD